MKEQKNLVESMTSDREPVGDSLIEKGLRAAELIIAENNYSSGASGLIQGYGFIVYKEEQLSAWEAAKETRGRGRPTKGNETAIAAFYKKVKAKIGLGEGAVKKRMQLYESLVAKPTDMKPIMDEIVKIKYDKQEVNREFVNKIAAMLAEKYGTSPKLTELYRNAGMLPKLEREEGAGNTSRETKEEFEICREEVRKFKTRMEKKYKDQDDDARIKVLLDWINSCPPFEPEQGEEMLESEGDVISLAV